MSKPRNIKTRAIRIDGEVAYVPLTKGYEAIIDTADVPLVEAWNWHVFVSRSGLIYAQRSVRRGKSLATIRMHRAITGASEEFEVDHRDGNGLNNRRQNLRVATKSQNNANSRPRKDNTSGFKGVFWNKSHQKWQAQINKDKKQISLGYFDTPEDAHAAYCKAAAEHHGEFAKTSS